MTTKEEISEYGAELDVALPADLDESNATLLSFDVSGQADIVFAIDTTGSMSSAINNVIANVTSFANTLSKNYNVKVNYALVDFKDLEADGVGATTVVRNGSSNYGRDVMRYSSHICRKGLKGAYRR